MKGLYCTRAAAVKLWQCIGYFMVIYLAGLQLLPQDPVEAAVIDGCSGAKMIRYITLPLMKPTIFVCLFLSVTESLNMFPLLMSLTNGGPGHASENIALYIYNEAFKSHRMGYASALAVVLTIVMAVIAGLADETDKGGRLMAEKKRTNRIIAVILWLICAAMFLPMVFVIMNSFKTFGQVVMEPLALPESWNLDNFKEVMNTGHYAKIFGNTIYFAVLSGVIVIGLGAMAGYKLARMNNKIGHITSVVFMIAMMLPFSGSL